MRSVTNVDISKFQPLFDPEKLRGLGGGCSRGCPRSRKLRRAPPCRRRHPAGGDRSKSLLGQAVTRPAPARLWTAPGGANRRGPLRGRQGRSDLAGKIGFDACLPQRHRWTSEQRSTTSRAFSGRPAPGQRDRRPASGRQPARPPPLDHGASATRTPIGISRPRTSRPPPKPSSCRPKTSGSWSSVSARKSSPSRKKLKRILLGPWGLDLEAHAGGQRLAPPPERSRSWPSSSAGNLEVRKEPNQELQVFGKIQPVVGRSFVQLMSRRFDLKSGDVTLNGPLKQARSRAGGGVSHH